MNTKLYPALLLALSTGAAAAQTLTDANSIPAVGYDETRTLYGSSNATGWTLTGTGNTWDATAVTPSGFSATSSYRAPGDSPFAGTYPGTTLCAERVQNGNTEWRHYVVNAAQAEMIGISALPVVGGRTYCTYPLNIGGNFSDSWTINGNNFSDSYTYVASGTVQAPWGTIPDVLLFETSGGFSYYIFLASNVLDPIGDYTPGFGISLWKVDLGMGLGDAPELNVGLWPNPATDEALLSMPLTSGFTYTLLDASGRAMITGNTTIDRAVVDVRSIAPGVYQVVAVDARGRRALGTLVVVH